MLTEGALDEVMGLMKRRLDPALPVMRAHGVKHLVAHLEGRLTLAEAAERSKLDTRHYAKRQFTWARRQLSRFKWVAPEEAHGGGDEGAWADLGVRFAAPAGKSPGAGGDSAKKRDALGRRQGGLAMLQTWRWFGPDDPVSLENAAQAGAAGIVSALHHMNRGEVWSEDEVLKRRAEIERAGLVWSVVESIGVGEEIKTRSGGFRQKIENYKQSIRNAARAGVKTFCWNFMAITDWTRTNVNWPLANGGTALRFDAVDYAAYDLFILERDGAEARLCARAHRDRARALPGDDARRNRRARTHADRLAAGARLRLRPAKLQAGARAL